MTVDTRPIDWRFPGLRHSFVKSPAAEVDPRSVRKASPSPPAPPETRADFPRISMLVLSRFLTEARRRVASCRDAKF